MIQPAILDAAAITAGFGSILCLYTFLVRRILTRIQRKE